jgi:hypothetical protein
MKSAILLSLLILPLIGWGLENDPVLLKTSDDGHTISYQIVNKTSDPIIAFEVWTDYTSGGFERLGCSIAVTVKSPGDLNIPSGCSLPKDDATGKPARYASRVTEVRFANGSKWTASR